MNMLKDRGDSDDYDEWFLSAFSELIKPFRKDMYETVVQVAQSEDCGTWARAECVNLIEEMIKAKEVEPSLVDKFIVKVLNTNEDSIVNASVISICRDEKLTHHHELIKECFARKAVDIDYVGDLEDVEIYMGLRVERETKKETTEMQNKFDSLYDVINRAIDEETVSLPSVQNEPKLGRNDPCPCGSGKKYKKCCLNK
ncbi:MAG: SEC-C domain-containing protein [Sulfurimonas sp.]|nr:SEC-C domain-containing protein [Sulfurimonas sp.]